MSIQTPTLSKNSTNPDMKITKDEFSIFADAFKGMIQISSHIRDQFCMISSIPPIPAESISKLSMKLPRPKSKKLSNKTLVLDLDNTLICAMSDLVYDPLEIFDGADVRKTSYIDSKKGTEIKLYVIIRPYAIEMLKQLSTYYEIIIFTAANKSYGDAVINLLDPEKTLIDHRLYRDNCIRTEVSYVKDLRIIDRNIDSIVMVDDSISSFYNQMENGICVSRFNCYTNDSELGSLWIFLRQISSANDVRVPIAAKYNLVFFYKIFMMEQSGT